jgi:hypothetical protein
MGRGGSRQGAGRPKKPLADKILEGNPGKRPLTIVEFPNSADLKGRDMPQPSGFLKAKQRVGKDLPAAVLYEKTWAWLEERKCTHLITTMMIEQYAMSAARWIQCEELISDTGFLAKHPTTGNAMPSPYVTMAQNFMKQTASIWAQIQQIVNENCTTEYKSASPQDDLMERLLNRRKGN